jgi:hypothetical protein
VAGDDLNDAGILRRQLKDLLVRRKPKSSTRFAVPFAALRMTTSLTSEI